MKKYDHGMVNMVMIAHLIKNPATELSMLVITRCPPISDTIIVRTVFEYTIRGRLMGI